MEKLYLSIALLCVGWTVKAQDSLKTVQLDEVVITGTKSEIPVEKSGKSIFKITQKDIETSGARSVADVLNQVPGLQMDGNFGPQGTNISYFIRGASSKRTLVLIDGVPFNDPSGINQTYDFRLLDLNQVESIEVLKGGLSTLYGSGAAAGVINIQLKKPDGEKLGGYAKTEYGSFNTFNGNVGILGTTNKVSYQINAGYKRSDGFSTATDTLNTSNFDDDGFKGYNLLGRVGYDFTDAFSLTFTGSLDDFESDYDGGAFSDASNTTEYQQIRFGMSPKLQLGQTKIKGDVFFSSLDRLFLAPESTFLPRDEYQAENIQVDIVVDHTLTGNLKLIGGVNYQNLAYSQPSLDQEGFSMIDPYLTLIFDQSKLNVQVGGRVNRHSEYGSNFVWNINPSYFFSAGDTDLKLFSSYSTSFITPSLFQLFGPFGANTELEPEESKSAEVGLAIANGIVKLEGVYFYRADENLIIFTDKYENAGEEIMTDGLEFSGSTTVLGKIRVDAHYSFVRGLDQVELYRIPSHKYGASVGYQPIENLSVNLSFLHTGERKQQYFDSESSTIEEAALNAFDLVDLNASYQYGNLTLSGSLNNIFDKEYQAIFGFNSVRRNYQIGLKYQFN